MIEIENLDYYYNIKKGKSIFKTSTDKVIAINKINLSIQKGSRNAIIGFNGAGKSTLIKLLIGILKPASGKIRINGLDPWKDRIPHVKNIGVVWGQRSTLWWDLPVEDSFKAIKHMYNVSNENFEYNINLFNKSLDFKSYWNKPVRKLSLGQRAKVEIVAALLHDPSILILDEPFLGLDFMSRKLIVDALNKLIDKKSLTLILTSHNINDINDLCKKITVLKKGQVVLNTNISDFKKVGTSLEQIIIEKRDSSELIVSNDKNSNIRKERKDENTYIIEFSRDEISSNEIIENIIKKNSGIVSINLKEKSLEILLKELLLQEKIGEN
jgi:ABC-2 type transport system ATP-binding protein